MTRTSEQNERGRQEYVEGSADPRFRPSVGRLMNKMRTLPQLDDPRAAAFIIDDMMHRRFVFNAKRPQELWYLAKQAVSYWQAVSPPILGFESGNELQNIFGESGKTEIASKIPTTEDAPKLGSLPKAVVEAVLFEHAYDEHQWRRDKEVYIPGCLCGKDFEFREEWAKHVRIRIWRALDAELRQTTVGDTPLSGDGEA